jgi:hypothetical protein
VIAADETGRLALKQGAVGHRKHPTAPCSLYGVVAASREAASEVRYHRVLLRFLILVTAGSAEDC